MSVAKGGSNRHRRSKKKVGDSRLTLHDPIGQGQGGHIYFMLSMSFAFICQSLVQSQSKTAGGPCASFLFGPLLLPPLAPHQHTKIADVRNQNRRVPNKKGTKKKK